MKVSDMMIIKQIYWIIGVLGLALLGCVGDMNIVPGKATEGKRALSALTQTLVLFPASTLQL